MIEALGFELPGSAHALFTTRTHGNLSGTQGPGAEPAELAREELRREIGARELVHGHQVHGTRVERWRAEGRAAGVGAVDADGHATAVPGLALLVFAADCLPVALGSPGSVAMLHAGWRGLAGGILEQGVRALEELGEPGEIVAVLGPCAGPCCYEVGPEVHAALGRGKRSRGNIDLRNIARERLLDAGVGSVLTTEACTICDERFFSHRREGASAGRQGGVAWRS